MIRPAIRPLVAFSFASGLASSGMDQTDSDDPAHRLYATLRDEADSAVEHWPDKLRNQKEMDEVHRLTSLFDEMTGWSRRARHIQTYMTFVACILEHQREQIRHRKKLRMIEHVLDAVNAVWMHYVSGHHREYEWCLQAGIRAGRIWLNIFGK